MNEHLKTPRNRAVVEKLIWYAVKEWRDREAFDCIWESDYVNIHSDNYPFVVHKKVAQFLRLKSVPVTHRKWTFKREVCP